MKITSIRVTAVVRGTLWWPYGEPFEMNVAQNYTPSGKEPFCKKWEGVESALQDVCDKPSGDSSSAPEAIYATLTITRFEGNEERKRYYDLV